MAVITFRRLSAWCAVAALGAAIMGHPGRALAQSPGPSAPVQGLDAPRFLSLARSSSAMQARASELVASRDTRPEARSFAQTMLEFRRARSEARGARARAQAHAADGLGFRALDDPGKPSAARRP